MNNVFQTDSIILTVEKLSGMSLKLILITWCPSPNPGVLSPGIFLLCRSRSCCMSKADI